MSNCLIIGAGGHAKVVAEILIARGHRILGFLDDDTDIWGEQRLGLPVLGGIDDWRDHDPDGLALGIGDNRARREIVERLGDAADGRFIQAISPRSGISPSASIGRGAVVVSGVTVNAEARVGDFAILNSNCSVGHDCVVGDFAQVAPGCNLAGGAVIGSGAAIYIGAVVGPRVRVGAWSTCAAGAVVVRDIPDGVHARGVPARWT
jgi:acetyltransferase EpsM